MAEQTIAPNEIKVGWEPDRDRLRALVERPGGVSETEFFQAMSPKTWEVPQADTVDRLLNTLGIVTPGVAAGRKRGEEYEQLAPLYKEFMARKLGNAFAPTQAEAIDRGLIPSPSVAPQSMMPGPRIETAPSNIDQALAPTGAAPSVGMALRPGMTGQGLDPLDLRGQPLGGHFQTASLPPPGLVPQEVGPFGVSPFQERQPQPPVYQPPMMAPGPMVPNMQAPLRPIDQGIVHAKTEQMKTRPVAAPHVTDAVLNAERAKRYEAIKHGTPEQFPGEGQYLENLLGVYQKGAAPNTAEGQKAQHEAEISRIEALNRPGVLESTINEKKARATWETRQAVDSVETFQARLDRLKSQTNWDNAQAGRLGQQVFNLQAKAILDSAAASFQGMKFMWAAGKLDDAGIRAYMQSYMGKTAKDLTLQGIPPNVIQELLGIQPDAMTLTPGSQSQGSTTSVPPVTGMTGNITPPPIVPQVPQGNKAEEELKALEKANPGYEYQRKPDGTLQRRKK